MRARAMTAILLVAVTSPGVRATAESVDLIAPVDGPIVRHFEPPPTPYAAGHRGLDFEAPSGSPVVAAGSGSVAFAGPVGGTRAVSIDHDDGTRTTYSYLSATTVRAGTSVVQGALIGYSGGGHPGEAHPVLHFGLKRGASYLDPEPVLVASMKANLQRIIRLAA